MISVEASMRFRALYACEQRIGIALYRAVRARYLRSLHIKRHPYSWPTYVLHIQVREIQ